MAGFDWNDLRGFLAVARGGRLTAAAARLGLDHSTLSRRLGALEHGLKAKLFDRSPSGYSLTEQGRRLLPIAEEMERLAIAAQERVGGSAANVEGSVRIGSPEGFGSYFLAPRIPGLRERHPKLTVQLVAASAVFSLARRDADVVISVSRPPAGRVSVAKLIDMISLSMPPRLISRGIRRSARPATSSGIASSAISASCSISPSSIFSSMLRPAGRPLSKARTSSPN